VTDRRKLDFSILRRRLDQLAGRDLDPFAVDRLLLAFARDIRDGHWRDWPLPEEGPEPTGSEVPEICLVCGHSPVVEVGFWKPSGRDRRLLGLDAVPFAICGTCRNRSELGGRVESALQALAERRAFRMEARPA
jgi:hypothetical protein